MDLVYRLHKRSSISKFLRQILQPLTYPIFGAAVKLALCRHHLKLVGHNRFIAAVDQRPLFQPLITVSNHHTCLDDFLLNGTLLTLRQLTKVDRFRWTLTAVDIGFTNKFYSFFFDWGKGVPVWRRVRDRHTGEIIHFGGGVYQPSLDFCVNRLNQGDWVHVFPQGRVIFPSEFDNEANFRLRWGVGRLIAECKEPPIVLPIWHCGLEQINPPETPYTTKTVARILDTPRILTIVIGDPVEVNCLREQLIGSSLPPPHSKASAIVHEKLTDAVQSALYSLRTRAMEEHAKHIAKYQCK